MITSYNELDNFREALPYFEQLDCSINYKQQEIELEEHSARLVNLAAKYIAEQRIPLQAIELLFGGESQALYKQISGLAIGFGAVNPWLLTLQKNSEQITELTSNGLEQARLIEEFHSERQHMAEENTLLIQQFIEGNLQLERLNLELNAALIDFDDNDMECKFKEIVTYKLRPMTKDYLLHLAKEIKQKIDPNLDINTYTKLAENVSAIRQWPNDEGSRILWQKFEAVSALNEILVSKSKPSERVAQFYKKLIDSDKALSEHRDSAWKRYTANTLIVLSIIVTGIISGLIVLGVVALTGNSPKFWQPSGQTFFQRASKEIENNAPEGSVANPG